MKKRLYCLAFLVLLSLPIVLGNEVACSDVALSLHACSDGTDEVVIDFTLNDASILDNLIYIFDTNQGRLVNEDALGFHNRRFDNFFISNQGANKYRIRWDTELEVEGLKIDHKECVGTNYITFETQCLQVEQCLFHEDCNDSEVCIDSFCKPLECEPCNSISDHRCTYDCEPTSACEVGSCGQDGKCFFERIPNCCESNEECSDSLTCTVDICDLTTNTCTYEPLQCDSLCREPNGCIILDQYLSQDDAFFEGIIHTTQKTISEKRGASSMALIIVLGLVFILICVQTSKDNKKLQKK